MADAHFIDGQALTPTSFAEQNGATWQPITYTGSYGDDGFLLAFATPAALGDDTSGNTNDWTQVNLGTENQVEDTPTQNHLTFNQDYFGTADNITLRLGSRSMHAGNTTFTTAAATAALQSEWYGTRSTPRRWRHELHRHRCSCCRRLPHGRVRQRNR
jgi:hypothetical protein